MAAARRHPASFRDPSGFVFESDGTLYRQVNLVYAKHYDKLLSSGLYQQLVSHHLLIANDDVKEPVADQTQWYRTLKPHKVTTWSYPYEWCFEQLKQAALLTLDIAQQSVEKGMVLKDATPYNVQFNGVQALFIDSLSFEILEEGEPWVAYHQFCTQFLFPLYIAAYTGIETNSLFKAWPQGISPKTCWQMLPISACFRLGVWMNVYLQKSIRTAKPQQNATGFSTQKMKNLLQHLQSEVKGLTRKNYKTAWSGYYEETIMNGTYVNDKETALKHCLAGFKKKLILDLGCNDGRFSRMLAAHAEHVIACDNDHESVCVLFERLQLDRVANILPLVLDAADPSPSQGFALAERSSWPERIQPDLIVALALVHHLAISRNIPFSLLSQWFALSAATLLIEWVPKEDEKVRQLLSNREDVFTDYSTASFEDEFSKHFIISRKIDIGSSKRVLYLMEKR